MNDGWTICSFSGGYVPTPAPSFIFKNGTQIFRKDGIADSNPAHRKGLNTEQTFTEAVDAYLTHADYLTDDDLPMVIALKRCAADLDANGVQAALLNVFGVTYRTLAKRKGDATGPVSEGEAFLDAL
jgi:hypothetical protein